MRARLTSPMAEGAARHDGGMLLVDHRSSCPCEQGRQLPHCEWGHLHPVKVGPRFSGVKRPSQPIALSTEVLLDREQLVGVPPVHQFAEQSPSPLIDLLEHGPQEQVGVAEVGRTTPLFGDTISRSARSAPGPAPAYNQPPFDLV